MKTQQSQAWPADQVERRPLATLIPYARNARVHDAAQVDAIAASIREWGWTMPVLVAEDNTIIAGHGRVAAAHKLGIAEVPVLVARGWSDAQRRAYVLADNRLTEMSGWDDELLALELQELDGADFDLSLIGFDEAELDRLLGGADDADAGTAGLTDPDDVPEPPEEPISKPGGVWILGPHRLVCGDCTDPLVVARALGGTVPHLMVTDPPYGVDYDADWRADHSPFGTLVSRGKVENDDRADWTDAWALFPGEVAYVWHGMRQCVDLVRQLAACGFAARDLIVWAKPSFAFGRGHYHKQHETCWYAVRQGGTAHWQGDRTQSTLWQIAGMNPTGRGTVGPEDERTGHGTQKPVECMARPIRNHSAPGEAVYEPFSGSGSTLIACEMTGRKCRAIEISPRYVDVAIRRWQAFTGQRAVLETTGEAFPT